MNETKKYFKNFFEGFIYSVASLLALFFLIILLLSFATWSFVLSSFDFGDFRLVISVVIILGFLAGILNATFNMK